MLGLRLFKPSKVVIAPKKTVVFGWQLEDGLWTPQDHVVSSLAKVELPTTIKQMRSYLGAVKQLSSCLPSYGIILSPFEKLVAAKASAERIIWTEDLRKSFNEVKAAIANPQGIHYPLKTDRLQISSDFSKQHGAVGGHMTIIREVNGEEVILLGGHFSATLTKDQCEWLSCEGEAKAAQLVAQHFEHFIRENPNTTTLLCDNMPTVRAWKKMQQGQFSSSPRISTFLSALSSMPIRMEHRPGSSLEITDHASRHASPPCGGHCAICKFIEQEVTQGNNCDKLTSTTFTAYRRRDSLNQTNASDVIERNCQLVFLTKEIFSQHVSATIIQDQTTTSLRDALISTITPLISIKGATVRLDSAPGFQSLHKNQSNDPVMKALKLKAVLGNPLNVNKNPSAESSVGELKKEFLNIVSANQQLDPSLLAWAVRNLNTRIRSSGKSALEIVTARDILTGDDIKIDEDSHLQDLSARRQAQHEANKKTNLRSRKEITPDQFKIGDIVMYREMANLNKARDTFVVIDADQKYITIRKMNDQLRLKTYEVKPEQLIKVFENDDTMNNEVAPNIPEDTEQHPKEVDEDITKDQKKKQKKERPPPREKSSRLAAKRQQNLIHSKIMQKLVKISVKEKVKKKKVKEEYVILETFTNQRRQRNNDLNDSDGDSWNDDEDFFGFDLFDEDQIDNELDDNSSDYQDAVPDQSNQNIIDVDDDSQNTTDPELDDTLNTAFSASSHDMSVVTMGNETRFSLYRNLHYPSTDGSPSSMRWDNDTRLINLSNPLEHFNFLLPNSLNQPIAQSPSTSENDEVFTPISQRLASTPITGRITRSMVSSGEYDLRSPEIVRIVRNTRSRLSTKTT